MSSFKSRLAKHLDVTGDEALEWKPICKVFWTKYYFLAGLIFVLILAITVPTIGNKDGPLATSITSSWIAVWVKYLKICKSGHKYTKEKFFSINRPYSL